MNTNTMIRMTAGLLFSGAIFYAIAQEAPPEAVEVTTADPTVPVEVVEAVQEISTAVAAQPGPATNNIPRIQLGANQEVEGVEITADPANSDLISVNFQDVRLGEAITLIGRIANVNIIVPQGLEERVTANLSNVTWRDALEAVLDDNGYVLLEKRAGILTILHKSQLKDEPLTSETLELRFITVAAAEPVVKSMLTHTNAKVTALAAANVLILSETPNRIQEIKHIVSLVDQPRKQVFIEAKFVELNDQAIEDLGINWQVLQGYSVRATGLTQEYTSTRSRIDQDAQAAVFTDSSNRSSASNRENTAAGASGSTSSTTDTFANPGGTTSSGNTGTTGSSSSGFTSNTGTASSRNSNQLDAWVAGKNFSEFDIAEGTITTAPVLEKTTIQSAILSADDFAVTLSALKQLDGVRVVSNPKILVANGEKASIHVGRNEPNIRAMPTGDQGTAFVYELDQTKPFIEIGVKLAVQPSINTERNISLSIEPELSRLLGQKAAGEAGTSFPITSTRKIKTEFALESGKTVAIGGLTEGSQTEEVTKVPLLGDIPIIGKFLFTHTHTEEVQDEIIIFVSVEMAHVEALNATHGIPQQGKLIQAWLQQNAGGTTRLREKSVDEILAEINLGTD